MDQIPWWTWLIFAGVIAVPLLFYFGPVIIGIWNVMPRWLKISLGVTGSLFLSYFAGRNKASRDAKERERQLSANAVKNREQIHDEVNKIPDSELDKHLGKRLRD